MKTLGIEIKGNVAVFCAIEEVDGVITDITGDMKKLELTDDESSIEVNEFMNIVHSYFKDMQFDKIGIIKRNKSVKAKFRVSPISFKLEGFIQIYPDQEIEFVSPQSLRAFTKKNPLPFNPKFSYQMSSAELAFYLLKKS
ncbi:MAG: DUF3010 family protein [Candidatus Delongbacteria bacterium]|jgi:hypothetical protein|nr:DUF3010 family protein [Candidatus Delongbacteria bacterium]